MKQEEGKKAKFPDIRHKYWSRFLLFNRFQVLPDVGGLNDQSHNFVKFMIMVLEIETSVYSKKKKPATPKNKSNIKNRR